MSRLLAVELFVATVREGSFSAAAAASASVSRHIGELEAKLGMQLLNRLTRHLSLTEAGKIYLQHTEQVLHSIEEENRGADRPRLDREPAAPCVHLMFLP